MSFNLSIIELLIISFFFITSINCVVTYVCCTKSLKILDKHNSISKAINQLRIYDQYLLSKLNVIIILIYFWLCYTAIDEFLVNNNYIFLLAGLLSFPITLFTVFVARVCYCYTGNVLLDTKLNELECLFLNFKRLLSVYLPFYVISFVVPTVYLFPFSEIALNIICIVVLFIALVLWIVLTPRFVALNYKAKPIEQNSLLRYRLEKLLKKHEIKNYKLYLWDSSKTKESNAMVSGFRTCYLFISSSLTEEITLPELETVITHELGHIKNKHLMKLMIGKIFIIFTIVFMILIPYFLDINGMEKSFIYLLTIVLVCVEIIVGSKVERHYENEADMYAACYNDPELFASALNKLSKYEEETIGVDEMFQTHPSTSKRIKNIEKKEK